MMLIYKSLSGMEATLLSFPFLIHNFNHISHESLINDERNAKRISL